MCQNGESHIFEANSPQHKMSTRYYNEILPNELSENENNIELGRAPRNIQPTLYQELKAKTERILFRNSEYNVGADRIDRVYKREERTVSEREDDQFGYHLVGLMVVILRIVLVCLLSIKKK